VRVAAAGGVPSDAAIRKHESVVNVPLPPALGSRLSGEIEEIGLGRKRRLTLCQVAQNLRDGSKLASSTRLHSIECCCHRNHHRNGRESDIALNGSRGFQQ